MLFCPQFFFVTNYIDQTLYNLYNSRSMFQILSAVVSSPKHGSILKVQPHQLHIVNQHLFFWNVLPKFVNDSISKLTFCKQMRKTGFNQVEESTTLLQNGDSHSKKIVFRGPSYILNHLKELQNIRTRKVLLTTQLEDKLVCIKKLMQSHETEKNQETTRNLQLLETVASLKQINCDIYLINSQLKSLQLFAKDHHHQLPPIQEETVEFRQRNKKKTGKCVRFYSEYELKRTI